MKEEMRASKEGVTVYSKLSQPKILPPMVLFYMLLLGYGSGHFLTVCSVPLGYFFSRISNASCTLLVSTYSPWFSGGVCGTELMGYSLAHPQLA